MRGHYWLSEGFHTFRTMSFILILAMFGSCALGNYSSADRIQSCLGQDACRSYTDVASSQVMRLSVSGVNVDDGHKSSSRCSSLQSICAKTNFFCFPSTLSFFLAECGDCKNVPQLSNDSLSAKEVASHINEDGRSNWFSVHSTTHKLSNELVVSCFLNSTRSQDQMPRIANVNQSYCKQPLIQTIGASESDILDGSSSPYVEINPPTLDWEYTSLYTPSIAFLTVKNTCNGSILDIYEPFSTNSQFYSYNFEEISLAPGESGSLAFVFLPKWLGSSSAHLVLQTSLGGFLVPAKGRASTSPYRIQPLVGPEISSDGISTKSISLHNPFDTLLDVAVLTAWAAISSENISKPVQAVCKIDASHATTQISSLFDDKEWINIKDSTVGLPVMGIRPYGKWQIDPHGTEQIMEVKLLPNLEGKVIGAFCLQLQSSSVGKIDTVIVPLEAEIHVKLTDNSLSGPVSAFFDFVKAYDERGSTAAILSLKNDVSHVLSVVKISEITEGQKLFQVKYMEGLVLFPGTFTHVAVIYSTHLGMSNDYLSSLTSLDCKLLVVTNDSLNSQIEIPCLDMVPRFFEHNLSSASFTPPETSFIGSEFEHEKETSKDSKIGSLGVNFQASHFVKWKVSQMVEADELILRNWKSQGSTRSFSILEEDIITFPTVKVGARSAKWISVSNPSERPIVMQLVLNAGAIIDQCRAAENSLLDMQSINFVHYDSTATRDGFSVEETAITEVCVHPWGKAKLGPIIFSPSNRCVWRSSALIRNNFSGVEWLHLEGFGGSMSLVLLDGSEPVQNLEFDFDIPVPTNVSMPELPFHMEETKSACSQPLSKVLYAENVGDMPLEIRKIEVSGTACGLDGFFIRPCEGFALNPGESRKLLISYQTDFFVSVVHRDLELALATGILVIPMKVSLPAYMLSICQKSFIWIRVRELSVVGLFAAFVSLLFVCRIIFQSGANVCRDCFFKNEDNPIATIKVDRSSLPCRNKRNASLVRNAGNSEMDFVARCSNESSVALYQKKKSSVAKEVGGAGQPAQCEQNDKEHASACLHPQTNPIVQSPMEKPMAEIERTPLLETSTSTANLRVRVQKERRRRKKRVSSTFSGTAGKFELSSQSGNSTPSSPLSPVASCTLKRSGISSPDLDHSVGAPEKLVDVAQIQGVEKEQVSKAAFEEKLQIDVTPLKNCGSHSVNLQPSNRKNMTSKLGLSHSTSPGLRWHACDSVDDSLFSSPPSAIAPHARAPGSKIRKEEPLKMKDGFCLRENFTYDIWGNHFCAFNMVDKQNVYLPKAYDVQEGESQSLFARSPQSLLQKLPEKSVSPAPKLDSSLVSSATSFPIYAVYSNSAFTE